MSTYVDDILNNIKSVKSNTDATIFAFIQLNFPIVHENILKRWSFGYSVEGGEILPSYATEEYKAYKVDLNPQAGGRVDLTLTGSLGEKLAIKKITKSKFEIFSEDEKYQKIGKKYGFKEFGMTDEETYNFLNELFDFVFETQRKLVYG